MNGLDPEVTGAHSEVTGLVPEPTGAVPELPGPDTNQGVPIYGPETWRAVHGVAFTYWDRWLLRLAVAADHGLDSLVARFEADRRDRKRFSGRDDAEAKLAQVDDLRARLGRLELTPAEVLGEEDAGDRRLLRKAQDKLLEQSLSRPTPAMLDTPRRRLRTRAFRGHWSEFPISPATFERELASLVAEEPYHRWRETLHLSRALDRLAERRARTIAGDAERLAFFRALVATIIRAMDRVDDSHGTMGETFRDAWNAYLAVPWERTGIEPTVYFRDLVELTVWEDYGLIEDLRRVFAPLAPDDSAVVEDVFERVILELRAGGFDYEEEKALVTRVDFLVARDMRDRFVGAARELGSRAWRPIVEMGEAAMKTADRELAVAVFSAADQPGRQQAYLREQCVKIMGAAPRTRALRRVK